ncbi:tRNA splicing endonuclease subunit protein [Rutstroemia sp. NJR-2017a BVV2]|nr:tRNA splicing endonuclease subunit protein [Rutstroemia sp. NJR-2017a BVV2]
MVLPPSDPTPPPSWFPSLTMSNETVNGIVVDAPNKEASSKSIRFANPDVVDDDENEEIDDDEFDDDRDENAASSYPKRKRASINYKYDEYVDAGNEEPAAKRSRMDSTRVRGVIIGVWRASSEPRDEDKHVIYGFVDKDNRLRTRLHARNRRGDELIGNIPTGTGRCWVTFPEIIFDPHLAPLSPPEVKEYVKIRSADEPEANDKLRHEADMRAVEVAKAAVVAGSAKRKSQTTPGRPPQSNSRHSTDGRTPLSPSKARNAPKLKNTKFAKDHSPADTGPNTGILLGYWKDSSEKRKEDKHAIFGIVGGSGFRVKVHKATRDGRVVIGNYPAGAGGLFVTYDKLILEPQLASLSKQQVREYVKLRQDDVRRGESEKDRKRHEQRAIDKVMGRERVATVETEESGTEQEVEPEPKPATIRRTPRTDRKATSRSQERDEVPLQQKRKEKTDEREKGREKPRDKHASDKAVIDEVVQRKLSQNIKGLQEIWQVQNAATLSHTNGAGASGGADQDDVKFHNGLKYEKKASGLLQGKFVHHPAIITVDGEAWVEYRFLSKELL